MPFYTYIIHSSKLDRYYTGSCEDLAIRLKRHNESSTKSTWTGIPWVLVYSEEFNTRGEAMTRENEIKRKKSRKYIEYLITNSGDKLPYAQV